MYMHIIDMNHVNHDVIYMKIIILSNLNDAICYDHDVVVLVVLIITASVRYRCTSVSIPEKSNIQL